MTSAEEFTKAFEYIDGLECWVWHDFKQVPDEIANRVFTLIDSNTFSLEYRLTWCVLKDMDTFFMKTIIPKLNGSGSSSTEVPTVNQ